VTGCGFFCELRDPAYSLISEYEIHCIITISNAIHVPTSQMTDINATAKAVRAKSRGSHLGEFVGLPKALKAAPKDLLNKRAIAAKLDDLKRFSVRQLQEAATIIGQLNRFNLKPDKRVDLVRDILGIVYAEMLRHYRQYQDKVISLPESQERRDAILACIEICALSAQAYKYLFQEIYTAKSLGYRRVRSEVIETGVRILELSRMEQRFRALRHQKLAPTAWLDINRAFFALLAHGDSEEPVTLLGTLGFSRGQSRIGKPLQEASASKLYLSIQLFGLLDAQSWSTRLFHAPDAYLDCIENAIVIEPDTGKEVPAGCLLTYSDNKGPPVFQRKKNMPEPRICIEYPNLYNRLVVDYEELAKMKFIGRFDAAKLSLPLLELEAIERFPFLEAMLFGLRPRERKQKRHAVFGQEHIRLYFGFKDVYKLLMDLASKDLRRVAETRAFMDTLAGYSAGVLDDTGSAKRSRWEIANFSTGGLLVISRESSFTVPIQIGSLVAFIPNPEAKRPLLGYVSRINRPNDQEVEVAIVRLSSHAEDAIVEDSEDKTGTQGKGVVMFKTLDDKWCLVVRHDYDFISGKPLRLVREDYKRVPARLGNTLLTKQDFIVYELSSPGL
jgi:hypothetical protein